MSAALSPTLLFAIGLFVALWLLAALWATGRGLAMQRRSAFVAGQTERLASLVEASPQLPVIVRADWRIEASERLGRWLGLPQGPRNFDELRGLDAGLDAAGHEQLRQAILGAQRGAKAFVLNLRPQGSSRTIVLHGAAAPHAAATFDMSGAGTGINPFCRVRFSGVLLALRAWRRRRLERQTSLVRSATKPHNQLAWPPWV